MGKNNDSTLETTKVSIREQLKQLLWVGRPLVILVIYYLLNKLLFGDPGRPEFYVSKVLRLSLDDYHKPFMMFSAFHNMDYALCFVWALLILAYGYRRCSWDSLACGKGFRRFVLLSVVALAWTFSTYEYNLYYDRHHIGDRLIVIVFGLLIWRHPLFLVLFLMQCILINNQFYITPLNYNITDKSLLFRFLIGVSAFLIAKTFMRQGYADLLFFLLCLIGCHYFNPGITKLKSGWALENRIHFLMIAKYLHGWLDWLTPDQAAGIAGFVKKLDIPMQVSANFIELSGLLLLLNRRLSGICLVSFALFHFGVLLTTSICFWKWALIDVTLACIILNSSLPEVGRVFRLRGRFVFSAILIFFSPNYIHPPKLTWYDTRISHTIELEAVDASGKSFQLGRHFMTPFDLAFCQNRFEALTGERFLTDAGGTSLNPAVAEAIRKTTSSQQATALVRKYGRTHFDPSYISNFQRFITKFFRALNQREGKRSFYQYINLPHHIWHDGTPEHFLSKETRPVSSVGRIADVHIVRVRLRKFYFSGSSIETMVDRVIQEFRIPRE